MNQLRALGLLLSLLVAVLAGCQKAVIEEGPDYGRPLRPGQKALRKITDPAQLPDLRSAFLARDAGLLESIDRSLNWYRLPSAREFFYPANQQINEITHEQAQASAFAFRQILTGSQSPEQFQQRLREEFDTWMSVGWNDQGDVLFTGYYTPIFQGSRVRTPEFGYPLYPKPADLLLDPKTGKFVGRRMSETRIDDKYPTREQIEQYPDRLGLAGHEVVWLRSKLDAYIIQVNGSGKLILPDGSEMYVGYAGYNGYDYESIGRMLQADGKLPKDRLSLPIIRQYFADHPADLDTYIRRNPRYVFFKEYKADNWPAGSLGFKVTPQRSVATDKSVFPRATVVMASTQTPDAAGAGTRPLQQFMLDQDTGGAIRAAGKCDLYIGVGDAAEKLAGRQLAEGRLYYFFLKPERVAHWQQQMRTGAGGVAMARGQ